MPKKNFTNLIHRYLTGECSAEEAKQVERWIRESSENRKTFEDLKKIWKVTPHKELQADLTEAWSRLEKQISENESLIERKPALAFKPAMRHIHRRSVWPRVAAVLLIGLFLALFSIQFFGSGLFTGNDSAGQTEITMQEIQTDRAHQMRMTFSDGTQVRLNSASLIRFPEQFTSDVREVYLEGEAWFDVQHNSDVEFIVHTADAVVRVLGTEFNVKAYEDEPDVEVVVADGLVAVQAADADSGASEGVLLAKGEMSRMIRGQGFEPASEVNVESHTAWTRGIFLFDETPFARVIAEWERRFDVDFVVDEEALLATPFTGEFRYESFDEMVRLTAITLEFDYTRENNTITIIRSN